MSKKVNLTLTEAVKSENVDTIVTVVDAAVEKYPADAPKCPVIETVYGELNLNNPLVDDETRIVCATAATVEIINEVNTLHVGKALAIEVARLIATNPVLRNIAPVSNSKTLL